MAEEMYFLYLDGIQRGPYTVFQIGHMVNSGLVDPAALFWCEGLEQWQPVTQLIEPKKHKQRRRIRMGAGTIGGIVIGLGVLWLVLPTLRQGWKEQNQTERTAEAAYWSARGVLRDHVGWFTGLRFRPFDPAKVRLHGEDAATVELEAESSGAFKGQRFERWKVELVYKKRLQMWVAAEEEARP